MVCSAVCLGCQREANSNHYRKTLKARRSRGGDLYESRRAADRRYDAANSDTRSRYQAAYRLKNIDRIASRMRAYAEANGPLIAERARRTKLKRLGRGMPWLTEQHVAQIAALYEQAASLSLETGVAYEVDHIVPLLGKKVSGLHVPWNMQVITKAENRRKGNRPPAESELIATIPFVGAPPRVIAQ